MNIVIIEDEILAADRMKELVRQTVPDATIVGMADSVEESLHLLRSQPMPDLILMDIELGDGQSFEIFQEIDITCPVIFTTAYDEYAQHAFKVHGIDYLLKPIQREELGNSINKFRQAHYAKGQTLNIDELIRELRSSATPAAMPKREHFLARQGNRLVTISVDEVACFYRNDRETGLDTYDNRHLPLDYGLDDIEQQIDATQFFRINPNYVVARRAVNNVASHTSGGLKVTLRVATQATLLIERDRVAEFRQWLGR